MPPMRRNIPSRRKLPLSQLVIFTALCACVVFLFFHQIRHARYFQSKVTGLGLDAIDGSVPEKTASQDFSGKDSNVKQDLAAVDERVLQKANLLQEENVQIKAENEALKEELRLMKEQMKVVWGLSGAGEGRGSADAADSGVTRQVARGEEPGPGGEGPGGEEGDGGPAGGASQPPAMDPPGREPGPTEGPLLKMAAPPPRAAPSVGRLGNSTHRRKQGITRRRHDAGTATIPEVSGQVLAGLEKFVHMGPGYANSVYVTPKNFMYTHSGHRKESYAEQTLSPKQAQLLSPTGAADEYYDNCAVVGNGRQLLSARLGSDIDSNDAIMRINQGPYKHFEDFVGSKTTHRLINHKWAEAYTNNPYLQLEKGVTLVVSRTGWREFLRVAAKQKLERPDVTMRLLTRNTTDFAGNLLREMKVVLCTFRLPFLGRNSRAF